MEGAVVEREGRRSQPAPRTILVGMLAYWEWYVKDLVEHLRKYHDARFIFLIPDEDRKPAYRAWCTEKDSLLSFQDVQSVMEERARDEDDVFRTAREFERKYGILYFRDIMQLYRGLATAFLNYASQDPRASLRTPPLVDITREINCEFRFFERLLVEKQVDLVIKRPDKGCAPCDYVAEKLGIPTTYPVSARYRSLMTWSFGTLANGAQLNAIWRSLPKAEIPKEADHGVPAYAAGIFSIHAEKMRFTTFLKDAAKTAIGRLDFLQSDLRKGQLFKNRGKRIPMLASIANQFHSWRVASTLKRLMVSDINEITRRPFLLYLLQLEPELGTNTMAKEFNSAAAIAQQLSLALPSGYRLVIKENAGSIGARRISFYEDLGRLPNVILADPAIPGPQLIAKAEAIVTVTGTAPIEAARLGKRAIIWSIHNEYDFLPSILFADSMIHLPEVVARALATPTEEERRQFAEAGWRFVDTLKRLSFDGADSGWFGVNKPLSDDQLRRSVDLLIQNWRDQRSSRFGQCHLAATASSH